jgi:plastocyanin
MRKALFMVVTLAVLVALFLAFAPKETGEPAAPAAQAPAAVEANTPPATTSAATPADSATPAATAQPAPADNGKVVELKVQHGRLVFGPELIKLTEGDKITLRVTSDTDDEMHLHGYNLHLNLTAGQTGELSLTANRSGRFEYELHHAHTALGVIEVYPR